MSGIPLEAPDWGAADAALHGAVARARSTWRRRVLLEGLAWTITASLVTLIVLVLIRALARFRATCTGIGSRFDSSHISASDRKKIAGVDSRLSTPRTISSHPITST